MGLHTLPAECLERAFPSGKPWFHWLSSSVWALWGRKNLPHTGPIRIQSPTNNEQIDTESAWSFSLTTRIWHDYWDDLRWSGRVCWVCTSLTIARPLRRSDAVAKPSAPNERCQHGDWATVYHLDFTIKDVKQHTWVTLEACRLLEKYMNIVDGW